MKKTIVKVQTSSASSIKNPEVMIYAEGRRGFWQGKSEEAFKLLDGPLKKAYHYATLKGNKWVIQPSPRAPDQDW